MVYQIVSKKGGMVMLMEDSELREIIGNILYKPSSLDNSSDAMSRVNAQIFNDLKEEIVSLLDKCKDFNVNSQKWSKPPNAHIARYTTPDSLKQAIDVTMERLETWSPKSWANLVKELQCEIKVAYDKFINVKKKYSGLIDISQGNRGSELIKAYIARDILDYVKYGINISLRCVKEYYSPKRWVRSIAIHFEMLARELEGLNVRNEDELRRLAEDVSLYKQCMLDFADNSLTCLNGSSSMAYMILSGLDESSSKAYMMLHRRGGVPFADLIERKKNELGFVDPFENLKDSQQDEVYQDIINEFHGERVQFVDFVFDKKELDRLLCHLIFYRAGLKARLNDN